MTGPTLFDTTPDTPPHVLYHRPSRRHKWREVGRAATGPEALALITASGLRGGMWTKVEGEGDPNAKEETK